MLNNKNEQRLIQIRGPSGMGQSVIANYAVKYFNERSD